MNAPATEALPLDLDTMRACVDSLLREDAEDLTEAQLERLTLQLRGHIMLAMPEIEVPASVSSEDSAARVCAFFCLGEAQLRLNAEPGRCVSARIAHAQRLARSVSALCAHYENPDSQCPNGPERAAYLGMLLHFPGCEECRALDEDGKADTPCQIGDRLYAEYRQARRDRAVAHTV
ncbi:DUF6415 family natural product biosynthesis protein [Streptomyces afghaniensis]|uniref:DUF6415 family natural product biosynthesis protein n=1 Tax=Streptomyces afghaniensis TaxID=66865 RepID=UPI00378D5516